MRGRLSLKTHVNMLKMKTLQTLFTANNLIIGQILFFLCIRSPPPPPTTHPHSRNAIHFFWYSNNRYIHKLNVHFTYVDQSIRCSGPFGKYNEQIQKFLRDRPRDVVQHITNNLRERYPQSAKKIKQVSELGIFTGDGKINVHFEDDSTYPHCAWKQLQIRRRTTMKEII